MSHTNSTPNYNLPEFVSNDKPAWLVDINGAFSDIDTAMKAISDNAMQALDDSADAIADAAAAQSTANTADGKASGSIASIANAFDASATYPVGDYVIYNNLLYKCITAVSIPGAWDSAKWARTTIEAIIAEKQNSNDNGLTTISKNIVGAINELKTQINNLTTESQYNRGDTYTRTSNIHLPGRINNAGTACLVTYPLSKPVASNVTSVSMAISGSPLAYVANGNVAIRPGTYIGTIVEDGIDFTFDLATTSTSKGSVANAIIANRTVTFA